MRKPCPDEEKLAAYLEGRLSDEDRSLLEEHLCDCQLCLEGLVVTNDLVRGRGQFNVDPVPAEVTKAAVHLVTSQRVISSDSLIEKLKRSVNNLGSRILDILYLRPWRRWQLAPIRGSKTVASADLVCLRVPFKEIETEIEIEKTGAGKAHIRVKLLDAGKRRKALRVTLKKGEREITSCLLDRAYVLFEDIPFDHYSISLAGDGVSLGTYLFEINETRHGKR